MTVRYIRPQLHQQGLQGLPVRPAPPEIAQSLEYEILPVVIRIIDPEVHKLHPLRERIEGRSVLLVCRCHDNPERPLSGCSSNQLTVFRSTLSIPPGL